MINFLKKYKYHIFLSTISLIVYFKWLSFSIFTYGDYWFQFSETLKEIPDFNSWFTYSGIGEINVILWRLIASNNLFFSLFGYLKFYSNIADKILIIWPWIILSWVSSYFLVRKI